MAYEPVPPQRVSGWAIGGLTFAAVVLTIVGVFQVIAGLVAILNDQFFVVARNYTYDLDVTVWGWIHLVLGGLLIMAGWALFGRKSWAGVTAIFLAMLSTVANFMFIPYYPFWSLVVIALDIWVIWSVTQPDVIKT